ncbi:MAG: hypothetical protein IME96_06555 [Proteobacteria bacterium]|nr:hypothetical protein [Pseudomonadota bacterium]
MKLLLSSFLLFLLLACNTSGNDNVKADAAAPILSDGQGEMSGGKESPPSYVPGEVLVNFREGTSQVRINAILKELGMLSKESLGKGDMWLLKGANNMPVEEMVEKLKRYEEVEHASPNRRRFKFRPRVDGKD